MDFVYFGIVFLSLTIVNWGGGSVVKHVKSEGFDLGPLRKCQETYDERVDFGR